MCSLVIDMPNAKITTMLVFSKGHWTEAGQARGDKRNAEDLDRSRGLAKIGTQVERKALCEQASIVHDFGGVRELKDIKLEWPTL